jgi:hypothetical protein
MTRAAAPPGEEDAAARVAGSTCNTQTSSANATTDLQSDTKDADLLSIVETGRVLTENFSLHLFREIGTFPHDIHGALAGFSECARRLYAEKASDRIELVPHFHRLFDMRIRVNDAHAFHNFSLPCLLQA